MFKRHIALFPSYSIIEEGFVEKCMRCWFIFLGLNGRRLRSKRHKPMRTEDNSEGGFET